MNSKILIFLLLTAISVYSDEIVEYTTPVFTHGEGGYPCIRIPSIIQVKSGKLLAFAECRTFTGDGCIPTTGRYPHFRSGMKRDTNALHAYIYYY